MNAVQVKVLYDHYCPVCRLLASLLSEEAPSHWLFQAWHRYEIDDGAPPSWQEKRAKELRIVSGNLYLEGEAAWAFLLKEEPRLQKYQNIAAKIGLSLPTNAKWLRLLGKGMRRLCFSCSWAR